MRSHMRRKHAWVEAVNDVDDYLYRFRINSREFSGMTTTKILPRPPLKKEGDDDVVDEDPDPPNRRVRMTTDF